MTQDKICKGPPCIPVQVGRKSRGVAVPKKKLRICQLTPCLWSGGTEERIARVLAALDRKEFELTWMGFGPIREALIEKAGPRVQTIALDRNVAGGVEPSLIPRLAAKLRKLRPDIMHVHNWSTSLYGIAAARLAGVPTVLYGLGGQDSTEPPSERRRAMMRALTPHVDYFTSVCGYLGDQISTHWGAAPDKIQILQTGIDLRTIDEAPCQAEVRTRLGLPQDALVVGAISVFRPVKRIPDLIEAMGKLATQHTNLHLLLVGNPLGVSPDELRGQAEACGLGGRFHLLGRVEKPAWTLPAFDVFVNCSAFEGTSNAIIEAMAAKIPIVATAVGGNPELVEHDTHGLLVPPADVPKLSEAIARLVAQPELRKAYGLEGRVKVERKHTYATMIAAYRQLYLQSHEEALGRQDNGPRRLLQNLGTSAIELSAALGPWT